MVYRKILMLGLAAGLSSVALPLASARTAIDMPDDSGAGSPYAAPKAPGHLECVPYARTTSGIQIYGDAHTWWGQARGRYATGRSPRVGAVMAIRPFNNSKLGHVATVSRLVDSRTILLSHANWSVPGKIERNVTALDVSPQNDWSQVRIWYGPAHTLGTTHWPVSGFIYNAKPGAVREPAPARLAVSTVAATAAKPAAPTKKGRRSDPIGAIIAGTY